MLMLRSRGGAAMVKLLVIAALLVVALVWWNRGGGPPTPLTWDASQLAALTADLSDAAGTPAPPRALSGAKRMLVYFSASWCPPCQAFTPRLVAWYQAHGDPATLPLLFVSEDHSAAAMREYMTADRMPWWGVAFGSGNAKALRQAYGGPGIPRLVLLDDHGRVLADSSAAGPYCNADPVLAAAAGR
jgi:thiol-disulfide isomerase/thioredoxin